MAERHLVGRLGSDSSRPGDCLLRIFNVGETGQSIGVHSETVGRDDGADVDRGSFDKLVLDHMESMQRLALRLTGDPEAAEDLMQDVLVRATRGWRTFRRDASFATWMRRIVINAFRDRVGRGPSPEAIPDETPDRRSADPPSMVVTDEVGREVARAVSALPPRQREVIVLSAYEQLSQAAIAHLLGVNEQNVRTNLHHARNRLREALADYLSKDEL